MASQQEDVVFVDAADSGLSHQSAAPQTTLPNSDQANTRATATPAAPANSNRTDAERVGHPCPHCPKTFDRLEHLERHSRKHSGEKPFTCLYAGCGKGFSRYDNMIQHYHCHFDKGHRRKKRDLRETLKRSFMEQEGEARPLTPAENLTLRTLVQASFTPSYPCPAPLPRGRKPSRSKLAGNKGTGNPATMASGSPFTSASQSPMSFSRSTSPSEASSTPTSSSPASPAASVSTSTTISANSSLSSLSSSTLPFSSPPSGILTPQCNEAPAPGSYLPFLFQPAQFVLPPSLGHTHSLNPRCQVDEAQLKLLKPKMF